MRPTPEGARRSKRHRGEGGGWVDWRAGALSWKRGSFMEQLGCGGVQCSAMCAKCQPPHSRATPLPGLAGLRPWLGRTWPCIDGAVGSNRPSCCAARQTRGSTLGACRVADGELGDGGEGGERRDGSTAQPSRAGSEELSEVVGKCCGRDQSEVVGKCCAGELSEAVGKCCGVVGGWT